MYFLVESTLLIYANFVDLSNDSFIKMEYVSEDENEII